MIDHSLFSNMYYFPAPKLSFLLGMTGFPSLPVEIRHSFKVHAKCNHVIPFMQPFLILKSDGFPCLSQYQQHLPFYCASHYNVGGISDI